MSFVRPARRVSIAAVSLSALVLAAACGGGGSGSAGSGTSSAPATDFTQKGPITYVQGKDTTGNVPKQIAAWNAEHPDEKVTFQELPDSADVQRNQMIQNAEIKSDKMTVLRTDVIWTSEFAAKGYIDALPEDQFPLEGYLEATVNTAKYFNKLYAVPNTSNGGLLFYRKDLLDEAGVTKPPTTWDEMKAACAKVKATAANAGIGCYAGQFQKYEGLTVNVAEAIDSAGGSIVSEDGKPTANSPEAIKGLSFLTESFKDGTIPRGAITWQEEQGRKAFQEGKLIFHRNWPYVYSLAQKTDDSSKVAGKFGMAPLPGLTGPGRSSLGGGNLAISKYAKNKGTAIEFIKWMNSEAEQKKATLATSNAPVLEKLYTDPELVKKFAYMPVLLKSIETANPRPKVVKYGDVTQAIQAATYDALQGNKTPDAALSEMQTKLETLTK